MRVNGFVEDVIKLARPKDAEGNLLPVAQVQVKLKKEQEEKLVVVLGSAIVFNALLTAVIINLSKDGN